MSAKKDVVLSFTIIETYNMFWKAILISIFAIESTRAEFQLARHCDYDTAHINFGACIKGIIDGDTLKKEFEDAKANGALGEMFKKYCAKSPQLKTCIHTFMTSVAPCLNSTAREHKGFYVDSTDQLVNQLIDYVCYKDGDRIALFVKEGGLECCQVKASNIAKCGTAIVQGINSVEEAMKLTINEQCAKLDEYTPCVVKALKECSTPTPGNMAESLSEIVRRSGPCAKDGSNSASGLAVKSLTLFAIALALLL